MGHQLSKLNGISGIIFGRVACHNPIPHGVGLEGDEDSLTAVVPVIYFNSPINSKTWCNVIKLTIVPLEI